MTAALFIPSGNPTVCAILLAFCGAYRREIKLAFSVIYRLTSKVVLDDDSGTLYPVRWLHCMRYSTGNLHDFPS